MSATVRRGRSRLAIRCSEGELVLAFDARLAEGAAFLAAARLAAGAFATFLVGGDLRALELGFVAFALRAGVADFEDFVLVAAFFPAAFFPAAFLATAWLDLLATFFLAAFLAGVGAARRAFAAGLAAFRAGAFFALDV
jgi:hypothetical protein